MSERFPGGFVTMTPTAPTNLAAPGVWTLDQALQNQQAGTWPYGGPMYIEDVFSTYMYTGNGATRTINNGIALGAALAPSLNGLPVTDVNGTILSLQYLNDDVAPSTNTDTAYAPPGTYFDVYVDLRSPATVTAYRLAPQGVAGSAIYNTITAFRVMASNDGSTWTTITTFSSISTGTSNWTAGVYRTFSFTNTTAYRYWRLQSTGTTGSDGAGISISEWQVTGTTTNAGYGGMVWIKSRNGNFNHNLMDTARGMGYLLESNTSASQQGPGSYTTAFSNGFSVNNSFNGFNASGTTYASWTFRKQAKFFDVVTWTGNGVGGRQISHSLGSVPGCILVKRTSGSAFSWRVYHRSTGNTHAMFLDLTSVPDPNVGYWNNTTPTSTVFTVGTDSGVNANGETYVAYLFAHDAGGFGASGNDNVVSCGSVTFSTNAAYTVDLGYEAQWVLFKRVDNPGDWNIADNLRYRFDALAATGGGQTQVLRTNTSAIEQTNTIFLGPTATGFGVYNAALASTWIYIAIRRPNKVPTSGTQVYKPVAYTGTGTGTDVNLGFPVDAYLQIGRSGSANSNLGGYAWPLFTRLLSFDNAINTTMTNSWSGGWGSSYLTIDNNFGVRLVDNYYLNVSGGLYSIHGLKRAPGFMDIVAYTGTGATLTVNHGLSVVPELIIFKRRDSASSWPVWRTGTGTGTSFAYLNSSSAEADQGTQILKATPTSTALSLEAWGAINGSGGTYVAYLFASCPGVSKVGTYTGTGAAQTIDCGFTSGARFVLIKRANAAGDWIMYDTARGIVNGNDPYIRINSVGTEVTGTDYISPQPVGFGLTASAPADLNANGSTYIFLAIS